MNFIARVLREPLFHFMAIGAALFVLYGAVVPATQNSERTIVISAVLQDNIAARFQATRQRPPTDTELENLVQNHLRDEVLYRQAVALGFNNNDAIVRSRMRQKMEFIADSASRLIEPQQEELQAILDADPEKYSKPGSVSFRQVYLGDKTDTDLAKTTLAQLERIGLSAEYAEIGARTMLPNEMLQATARNIEGGFGPNFAAAIDSLQTGVWAGPVKSAYGEHIVYVIEKSASEPLTVDDIRDTLVNEWRFAKSAELKDKQFNNLLAQYEVIIEGGDTP